MESREREKEEERMYKNIEKQVKLALKDQVEYLDGQVVSKTDRKSVV